MINDETLWEKIYLWPYRLWHNQIIFIPKKIKWFFQRGIRGYSDSDLWGFDSYLSEMIPKAIRDLKQQIDGYPASLHHKYGEEGYDRWLEILEEIAEGFDEMKKIINIENWPEGQMTDNDAKIAKKKDEESYKKFQKAMESLEKYFISLWW